MGYYWLTHQGKSLVAYCLLALSNWKTSLKWVSEPPECHQKTLVVVTRIPARPLMTMGCRVTAGRPPTMSSHLNRKLWAGGSEAGRHPHPD